MRTRILLVQIALWLAAFFVPILLLPGSPGAALASAILLGVSLMAFAVSGASKGEIVRGVVSALCALALVFLLGESGARATIARLAALCVGLAISVYPATSKLRTDHG